MGIAETPTIDRNVKSRSGGLILQQNPGSIVPTFRGNTIKGTNVPGMEGTREIDIFQLVFTDEVFQRYVDSINNYSELNYQKYWEDKLDNAEFKVF
jgi:hypothetical protein